MAGIDQIARPYRNTALGYPVMTGKGMQEDINRCLEEMTGNSREIFVLTDRNTRRYCLPYLVGTLENNFRLDHLTVEPGEASKSVTSCRRVWDWLSNSRAGRNSILLNLGGGVVTDLGGFAAATYQRGIRHVNVPTTLLAQADAAIGGKVALNFNGIKNQLGLFRDPAAVFCDSEFTATLPEREIRSGLGEILKMTLLAGGEAWETLKNRESGFNWPYLIAMTAAYKIAVVGSDPYDTGMRKVLNFGHTIGHAFEAFAMSARKNEFSHGESVAAGILCESYISGEILGLNKEFISEIFDFVRDHFPPLFVNNDDVGHIIDLARSDKKNIDGSFRMSLLRGPGDPVFDQDCPEEFLVKSIRYYLNSCSK